MVEFIMGIFGEFIVYFLLQAPGAFIRWSVFGKKRFVDYLADEEEMVKNAAVFVLLLSALIVVYWIYIHSCYYQYKQTFLL